MGSSGKTVKIWTTFTRPDNSLPQNTGRSQTIPRPCLSTGCEMLSAPNPIRYTSQRTDSGTIFAIIHDPDIIYRPNSVQFYLSQPSSMPEETTFRRKRFRRRNLPLTRAVPGYDAENAFLMLFGSCFSESVCRSSGSGT